MDLKFYAERLEKLSGKLTSNPGDVPEHPEAVIRAVESSGRQIILSEDGKSFVVKPEPTSAQRPLLAKHAAQIKQILAERRDLPPDPDQEEADACLAESGPPPAPQEAVFDPAWVVPELMTTAADVKRTYAHYAMSGSKSRAVSHVLKSVAKSLEWLAEAIRNSDGKGVHDSADWAAFLLEQMQSWIRNPSTEPPAVLFEEK